MKNNIDAKNKFLSDMTHCLRTHIAIIAMESEVALDINSNYKEKDLIKVIKSNMEEVRKMAKLLNNL